jgi:hypothetical protein
VYCLVLLACVLHSMQITSSACSFLQLLLLLRLAHPPAHAPPAHTQQQSLDTGVVPSPREIKNGTLFADKMFIICRQGILFADKVYYVPTKVHYLPTRYTMC